MEPVPFERPLPRHQSGSDCRQRCHRRQQQVGVSRDRQRRLFRPLRREIQCYSGDEQRDREMDQRYVLRVLFHQHFFHVERMHLIVSCYFTTIWPVIFG